MFMGIVWVLHRSKIQELRNKLLAISEILNGLNSHIFGVMLLAFSLLEPWVDFSVPLDWPSDWLMKAKIFL